MNAHDANAIAQWHYPKPYSFYDLQADKKFGAVCRANTPMSDCTAFRSRA